MPKTDIDNRYLIRPYYLVPDGKVGHDAFAVIRETIRSMNKVAIGRVVLTNREHIIALEPLDKGLMGTLLRYPYEVRSEKEYFDDIQDVKVTKDMLDLAKHIVEQKSGSFEPDQFEDRYESALIDLINQKRNGLPAAAKAAPKSRRQRHQSDGRAQAQPRQREAGALPRPTQRPKARSRRSASKASAKCCCRSAAAASAPPKETAEAGAEEGREAGTRAGGPIEEGGIIATLDRGNTRCRGRRRSTSRLRCAAAASS